MKFSIIVPVYNCESLIGNCIESILSQTYENWELILINDGSIDQSYQICQNYSETDNRIVVFNQENSGPSNARNNGIKFATGTHCLFVDSDDWLEYNMLEILKNEIIEHKSDIIFFSYYHDIFKNNKKLSSNIRLLKNRIYYSNNEFFENLEYYSHNGALNPVWNKLYDMNLIKKVKPKFPEDVKYTEDLVFNLKIYKNANKIQVIGVPLYHYISHSKESLSIKFNEQRLNELKVVYSFLFEVIEEKCSQNINYYYNSLIHEVSVFIISLFKNRNYKIKSLNLIYIITGDIWLIDIVKKTQFIGLRNNYFGYLIKYKLNHLLFLSGKSVNIIKKLLFQCNNLALLNLTIKRMLNKNCTESRSYESKVRNLS